jgi:hypothetical protein
VSEARPENGKKNFECEAARRGEELVSKVLFGDQFTNLPLVTECSVPRNLRFGYSGAFEELPQFTTRPIKPDFHF